MTRLQGNLLRLFLFGLGKAINGIILFAIVGIVASAVILVMGGIYLCLHLSLVWH